MNTLQRRFRRYGRISGVIAVYCFLQILLLGWVFITERSVAAIVYAIVFAVLMVIAYRMSVGMFIVSGDITKDDPDSVR